MIHPLTVASFLIACGSGLYLYQSKHEVQLLDRTIEKTVHETSALREQSRLLSAEWTMLNDPERLRQFSDTYLNLKAISPGQFTSLADLDGKLPAPIAEMPAPSTDEEPVSVDLAPLPAPEPAAAIPEKDVLPVPPVPAVRPVQAVATVARPAETKVAAARPVSVETPARQLIVAEPRSSDQRSSDQHVSDQRFGDQRGSPRLVETHAEVRAWAPPPPRPTVLAAPRPGPVSQPVYAQPASASFRPTTPAAVAPAPYAGSLLGMAHGSMPPAPRPTPVNATYSAN